MNLGGPVWPRREYLIWLAQPDVATGNRLRCDVTTASTTNGKGLVVVLEFETP